MSTTMTEVWTAEQLSADPKGKERNPMLWGVPGYLTKEETDVFFKFKNEIEKRGGEFRETVYSFGEVEGEAWALGRWLRARKFVYDDVIKMIEEATECRKSAKGKNFYPDAYEALGVDKSIFYVQYPQLYSGSTKDGVPVFFSKPGVLNVDAVSCITTLDGIIKFHWHVMMHDFANRLRAEKAKNPNFKKFECFCVLDLDHLSALQLSGRALTIVKEQAAIDSLCFPETMSKMLIVNAPTFFSATWRIIKGWLDARTAAKIEVISNRAKMEQRLLEYIEPDQLPIDYGGKGPDTTTTMMECMVGDIHRMSTKMLYLRGSGSETIEVKPNEKLEVAVYTRALPGATFTLTESATKKVFVEKVLVKHEGTGADEEKPTTLVLNPTTVITGPVTVKVKAESKGGRFSSYDYLLVYNFYPLKESAESK